jgi:hypothetical protein
MGETIRVRTTPNGGDTYIKVPIQQDFDFIKILSLKISQDDVYPKHCADYGVVVGRVTVNGGLGVPNAKVSIFIPLSDDDESNPLISSVYPFKAYSDKDSDGLRYNLLPKNRQTKCHVPVGSFPNKREVLDNNDVLEIFEKYYKYTTSTNKAGDYMICGVPVGNQNIHIDVDLSDIGILSQKPSDMIRNGSNPEDFDSPTKFKTDTDLNRLPQIITENNTIDILSFWGDTDECNIGINRYDIDLPYRIEPVAYFIGSIFSDSEKNSVNKHCRPRIKMGKMSETTTSEGKIELIRKVNSKTDSPVENFTVDGGRNIDEDGAWVVPVPMNIDYIITDEFGDIIPSENPKKGVATRARVRFRISMDNTGGEGRLRTRAKFLVPNNPPANIEGDYSFSPETPDINNNFTDLIWNNIYTVRNFIPRIQRRFSLVKPVESRNFIGIKNVDDCETFTEFPYNRSDTKTDPMFVLMCLIMGLVIEIIALINGAIIYALNWVIHSINGILKTVCTTLSTFGWCICSTGTCDDCCTCMINYVKPIILECGLDNLQYIPGYEYCGTSNDGSECNGAYVINDCNSGLYVIENATELYMACKQAELADSMNIYRFDFYNDWVNGALYAFLFKFKQKDNGKIKYCAYDCEDWYSGGVGFPNAADGNNDGVADNSCNKTIQFDSCAMNSTQCEDPDPSTLTSLLSTLPNSCDNVVSTKYTFKEGLIKRQDGNLYYASSSHDGYMKLFATDITLLGSATEWNIYGTPVIHQFLTPTTYKFPPIGGTSGNLVFQKDETVSCIEPVLFYLNCKGVKLYKRHCKNIRLICEIGRGLDEDNLAPYDYFANDAWPGDGIIDDKEIENEFVRRSLRHMNVTGLLPTAPEDEWHNSYRHFSPNHLQFGLGDAESYQAQGFNGMVSTFIPSASGSSLPYNNSYYFYFGLHIGKTSLDKLNNKYFTDCDFPVENDFMINYSATNVTTTNGIDGTITIDAEGGITPYLAYVTLNGQVIYGFNGVQFTNTLLIPNLAAGTYIIKVVDNSNKIATITVIIIEPVGISFGTSVTNAYTFGGTGTINVNYIVGGTPTYTMTLVGPSTNPITHILYCGFQACVNIFTNLPTGDYVLTVTDSGGSLPQVSNLNISEPTQLVGSISQQSMLACYNSSNGTMTIMANGGTPPYTIAVTHQPTGTVYNTFNLTNLSAGAYNIVITDSHLDTWSTTTVMTQPSQLTLSKTLSYYNGFNVSCYSSTDGAINMIAAGGTTPYTFIVDGVNSVPQNSTVYHKTGLAYGSHTIGLKDGNNCTVATQTVNLTRPNELILSNINVGSISFGIAHVTGDIVGGAGALVLNASNISTGGSDNVSFNVSVPNFLVHVPTSVFEYTFTVTDGNGCTSIINNVLVN